MDCVNNEKKKKKVKGRIKKTKKKKKKKVKGRIKETKKNKQRDGVFNTFHDSLALNQI